MPKDFNEFLNDEKNSSDYIQKVKQLDPNYITNKAQTNEISSHNQQILIANCFGTLFTNLLVAPLTTIYTSLQLSVLPHRNKYGDVPQQFDDEMKALIKTKTDLTVQDKRKYELIIKSGVTGTNKPFRAPIYLGYFDVIRALSNQGLLGFFKGYMVGCQNAIFNSFLRFSFLQRLDYQWGDLWHQGSQIIRSILLFSSSTLIDVALNPLMMCQSRFILQNRLQNFYLYKNQRAFFHKHTILSPKEFYKGASGHIYKNIFLLISTIPTFNITSEKQRIFINSITTQIIGYPWLTVIRRLQCQSKLPGMIPIRYAGPLHCFKLTLQEEGIRGIYRGFLAFTLANFFINYLMYYNQIYEQDAIDF